MTDCKSKHVSVGVRRLNKFDAAEILGTPFSVFLHDAVDQKFCQACGDTVSHVIPNGRNLFAVVAVLRACHASKLNGKEVRFLRKSLAKKSKDLAEELALSPEQLSRFENDKQPISEVYERLLRATVCLGHFDQALKLGVDVKGLLSIKVRSVRPCSETFFLNLRLNEEAEQAPHHSLDLDKNDSGNWQRQAS